MTEAAVRSLAHSLPDGGYTVTPFRIGLLQHIQQCCLGLPQLAQPYYVRHGSKQVTLGAMACSIHCRGWNPAERVPMHILYSACWVSASTPSLSVLETSAVLVCTARASSCWVPLVEAGSAVAGRVQGINRSVTQRPIHIVRWRRITGQKLARTSFPKHGDVQAQLDQRGSKVPVHVHDTEPV